MRAYDQHPLPAVLEQPKSGAVAPGVGVGVSGDWTRTRRGKGAGLPQDLQIAFVKEAH